MSITHEEARKLIQFSSDEALKPQQLSMLEIHLKDCMECRIFAEEIKDVEDLLIPAMLRHWNFQPTPLSIEAITSRERFSLKPFRLLITRTAIISIVFAAFIFSAWEFSLSRDGNVTPMPISVLPIPTPSGQSTNTKSSVQSCEEMIYQVQENDTLEQIAAEFSASKEKIMASNHLSTEVIHIGMELLVPICNSTPTGTVHPSTLTTTFTPLAASPTSTPGG